MELIAASSGEQDDWSQDAWTFVDNRVKSSALKPWAFGFAGLGVLRSEKIIPPLLRERVDDVELAVVPPEAVKLLDRHDERAIHYEVALASEEA